MKHVNYCDCLFSQQSVLAVQPRCTACLWPTAECAHHILVGFWDTLCDFDGQRCCDQVHIAKTPVLSFL